jgi:hypothetical protein
MVGRRKKIGMEPPECNGDLLGPQKRDYLAKPMHLKRIRIGLYLIFKALAFGIRKERDLEQ